ncbi:hypothetical protein [Granulicella sp. L46]|uniref:hypothetical protein n=1 Tax=Granulicella sp. L46 TaxID=1641865 RepID=UPI00131E58B7|nr:hypothetical protein [Granulicella sp. L46]
MPESSNPRSGSADAPIARRKMPRLNRAGWIIKSLASLFVFAFLCAYAHTYLRYGNSSPRPQIAASVTHATPQTSFTSTHPRAFHRHQPLFRPAHQLKSHAHHAHPYHFASLRHLRRLFSQLLVVRS